MYVCICNAIKERDLRKAAVQIHGDAETVYEALGHIPQCCQCLEDAEEVLLDARTAKNLPVSINA